MAQGVQPATASQRFGLSAAGTRGQIAHVPGTGFYPLEWTVGGTTREGRSAPLLPSEISERIKNDLQCIVPALLFISHGWVPSAWVDPIVFSNALGDFTDFSVLDHPPTSPLILSSN